MFKWLRRKKAPVRKATEHVTVIPPKMYDKIMTDETAPERSTSLTDAARRAETTVRKAPPLPRRTPSSSPSRSSGPVYGGGSSGGWSPSYDSGSSSSSDCGGSSGSSDSGSSGSCDSGGF